MHALSDSKPAQALKQSERASAAFILSHDELIECGYGLQEVIGHNVAQHLRPASYRYRYRNNCVCACGRIRISVT